MNNNENKLIVYLKIPNKYILYINKKCFCFKNYLKLLFKVKYLYYLILWYKIYKIIRASVE